MCSIYRWQTTVQIEKRIESEKFSVSETGYSFSLAVFHTLCQSVSVTG